MIIAPVAELDLVIRETLAEVRKGIATARQKNQTNPATGLMADLPEFVDFEIVGIPSLPRKINNKERHY